MTQRKKRTPRRQGRPPKVRSDLARAPGGGGVLVLLAIMLLPSAAGVFFTYGTVRLECTRPAVNETARCTGGATGHRGIDLKPFDLLPNSIRYDESIGHKGYRTAWVATDGGKLEGAALRPTIAHRFVSEAEQFRISPTALAWHDEETSRVLPLASLGFGLLILGLVAWAARQNNRPKNPPSMGA